MNVTARISLGANAPVATWCAIRRVIVVVLPEPGAGEDADRPAHRLGGTPLLGVQALEDVHRATLPRGSGGQLSTAFVPVCGLVQRVFEHRRADALRLRDHLAEPGRHAEHVVLGDERLELGELVVEPGGVDRRRGRRA